MKQNYFFLFYIWFSYLLITSILLFTAGFLLSRAAQPYQSKCSIYNPIDCSEEESECYADQLDEFKFMKFKGQYCVPTDYKAIILVIDALRYDFTLYNPALNSDTLPYQNKLPVIHKLLENEPNKTRLYKFIADPPTTTLQRLKALTSGTLPTFIDAGSNFGTEEINEDNIIDQSTLSGKNVVFMGDDTWMSLYPNRFLRSYPFPSFNVFDLDTVDDGVRENLEIELKKNDWKLLIGHFLGVDHCGHRYGPLHSEMARKLSEMNSVIENVIEKLDEKTILFVIGDHGMTMNGDHGGESEDEVNSAMFVYSNSQLQNTKYNFEGEVRQIDLVPTLATILGVPIPYSNLGSLILDTIPSNYSKKIRGKNWHSLVLPLWSNLQQMVNYIEEYSITNDVFKKEDIDYIGQRYNVIHDRVKEIDHERKFVEFEREVKEIMDFIYTTCREVWSQFDGHLIIEGLTLNVIILYFIYIILDGVPSNKLSSVLVTSVLFTSLKVITVSLLILCALYSFNIVESLLYSTYLVTGLISVFMLAMVIIKNWECITTNWYERSLKKNWFDFIYRFVLFFHVIVPFSNSYVVEESSVSLFLLVTVFVMITVECVFFTTKNINKFTNSKLASIGVTFIALVLLRFTPSFWRCREEQSWCTSLGAHYLLKSGTELAQKHYVVTLVFLSVFVILGRKWLRSCGSLKGNSVTILSYRYLPTVIVVCIGSYWILDKMPLKKRQNLQFSQPMYFAWCVYLAVFELILCTIFKPLCVYIVSKNYDSNGERIRTVPHIYQRIKCMLNEETRNDGLSNIPIVYGLTTVYSSPFMIAIITVTLLLVLLLGCASAAALILMCLFAVFLLFVSSMLRHLKAEKTEDLLFVPNSILMAWMLISHYFFYGTGHQPTFPNIPWEAGFIGSSGEFRTHVIPAALILFNIYGSYILMGFAVPLLLIAPFALSVIFPHFFAKKQNSETKTGEVFLYQSNDKFISSVFSTCCRYVLLHGLRVFMSMLAAAIHSRHLMVWKIFTPKFIFESISFIVTLVSVLLGYLFTVNINFKVRKLFETEL